MAASTRSIHSRQRAAGGRSRRSVSSGSSPSRRRRRAAAVIGRTPGMWAGQKIRARRQARPGGRTAAARRGRSSARGGRLRRARRNLGEQQIDDFGAGLARSLGATASKISERRERSAATSRADAAARATAPTAAFGQAGSPSLGRPPPPDRKSGSKFSLRSAEGAGPSAAGWRGRCRMSKERGFRLRRRGVREGGKRQGGGLCGRRNRIALPCATFQACCEAVGVHGQVEPRRCGGSPAWVEAGRPPGAIPPERRRSPRSGPASPTAKRRSRSAPASALSRSILAQAPAL